MDAEDSGYHKERLFERLGKLAGGVAIIKVGGRSETEIKERKDRVEDALSATRAALAEGIVPGGGVALMKLCNELNISDINFDTDDEKLGAELVLKMGAAPYAQILYNAGVSDVDRSSLTGELISKEFNIGYDAKNGTVVDMISAGIVDPAKVTRVALESAVSIVGLFITTEAAIVNIPEKEEEKPNPFAQ